MKSLDSVAVINEDEDLKSYSCEMSEVLKTPVNFDNDCCYKAIISGAYNFFKPSRYALELIRADVSSRIGASLGNAFLLDLQATGLLVPNLNLNTVFIDKSKIDRQKTRVKSISQNKHMEDINGIICIGVDGKVDKDTLFYREVKKRQDKHSEHHLTFTVESGSEIGSYLTHRVIPIKGAKGLLLGDKVVSVLNDFKIAHSLKAILFDNTATNTGWKKGLVTAVEKKNNSKLHIIGCSLHQNELPFRAIFEYLDGGTKSPNLFSGPIGKLCENNYQDLPQVDFIKISSHVDNIHFDKKTLKDLSSDQRLLLEYVLGVSNVDHKYSKWKIGPLNHARWLNLAIRLLCLWTRGTYLPEMQDKLHQIIKFIVQVYAVSWFEIKLDNKFHNQQLYIFNMIKRIKEQSEEIKTIAL
nr:uncharacterized protein LOC124817150 [Hydra vulgaris]